MVPNRSNKHYAKPHPRDRFARALLLGLLETAVALAVTPASLEALLPCPGRREIYLREIVCEYVRTLISVTPYRKWSDASGAIVTAADVWEFYCDVCDV